MRALRTHALACISSSRHCCCCCHCTGQLQVVIVHEKEGEGPAAAAAHKHQRRLSSAIEGDGLHVQHFLLRLRSGRALRLVFPSQPKHVSRELRCGTRPGTQ
jgi:hypothetical protein